MPGDCCECGACCFSDSSQYVPVSEADGARLGEKLPDVAILTDGGLFLRMENGHCAQLEFAEGAWVCQIYNQRPFVCRELKRGSPPCLAERALKLVQVRRAAARIG